MADETQTPDTTAADKAAADKAAADKAAKGSTTTPPAPKAKAATAKASEGTLAVKETYSGETPMSVEDSRKAQAGRDPLTTAVPENDPTGGLGPQAAAQNTGNPFGPTGSVTTGSDHEVQTKALSDEKAARKQGTKEAADEKITPGT